MKKLLCCAVLLVLFVTAFSQKIFFVYLQSEGDQPFWVRIGEQVTNSNTSGYLVLPRMADSTYIIKVGFHGKSLPEQSFQVPLNGKDRGFLVKNFGEKGWGLFDMQSLAVIMPEVPKGNGSVTTARQVSAFTEVLSRAANDPTLKEKTVFAKEEEKPAVAQAAVLKEPEQKAQDPIKEAKVEQVVTVKVTEVKAIPGAQDADKQRMLDSAALASKYSKMYSDSVSAAQKQQITRRAEQTDVADGKKAEAKQVITPEGIATGKVEETRDSLKAEEAKKEELRKEQIRQEEKRKEEARKEDARKEEARKEEERKEEVRKEDLKREAAKAEELKKQEIVKATVYERSVVTRKSESSTTEGFGITFIDAYEGRRDTIRIVIPNPKTVVVAKPVETKEPAVEQKKPIAAGNGEGVQPVVTAPTKNNFEPCKVVAKEADFLQLRRKMAAQTSDENMIKESRKGFKAKCFTTAQIKDLGNLFLNEAGKFQFYEGAYPFVADRENFGVLQEEFKDNYFVYRFRNLIN